MTTTDVDSERRTAELRKKVEYQVACEERAHRIVERLIDNPVNQEWLINALHYITKSHYTDIVEERAVVKLCGYPLCPNSLTDIPKQKYMISTKTNKVYDIESRKNFCSARCYKASKHLESQVSNDPVWTRKNLRPVQYDLLPMDMKTGKIGDEVAISKAGELRDDLSRLEKTDKYEKNLADRIHEHILKGSGIAKTKANKDSLKVEASEISEDSELEKAVRHAKKETANGCGVENAEDIRSKTDNDNKNTESDQVDNTTEDDNTVYTIDKAMEDMKIDKYDSGKDKLDINQGVKVGNVKGIARKDCEIENDIGDKKEKECFPDGKEKLDKRTKKSKVADTNKAKTDYLMQLLDRKKTLLAKMADIQNDVKESDNRLKEHADERKVSASVVVKDMSKENVKEEVKCNAQVLNKPDEFLPTVVEKSFDAKKQEDVVKIEVTEDNSVKTTEPKVVEKTYCKTVAEKQKAKKSEDGSKGAKNKTESANRQGKPVSVLDVIFLNIQSWMTEKTVEFLRVDKGEVGESTKVNKAFEKQYKALVAKVDAQERDFDGLLGEESMEPELSDLLSAPLPHFDVLREELETDQMRVREFMKGSFTYKVTEKHHSEKGSDGTTGVVLPTVDRYDQLKIRQKIVLERINRVLPDVLSPLHLLVQDMFTDLRQLVCTFNLTSDNIFFKPMAWTVVTVILLRMLSRKVETIQRNFMSPGAEKYFTILLSTLKTSLEHIDLKINTLLKLPYRQ